MNSTKPFDGHNFDSEFFLDVMLNETEECIIFVDENGIILELSHAYAQFLGVTRDEVLGMPVTEVIENTRLPEVIKSRKPEIAQPHKINGTNMIASRTSLYEKMEKHNIRFD